jgi:hypothetical protein
MIEEIRDDVDSSLQKSDYEAVDVLWVALLKAANLRDEPNERSRMLGLVLGMEEQGIRCLLQSDAVNALLNLDPPLETVLTNQYERLATRETAEELKLIRDQRANSPATAIVALGGVLKRIRNKRAHGFKSAQGPRDQVILGSARQLLFGLCQLAIK